MSVGCVRPKVSELLFLLYSRALHPELFGVYREQQICRDDYQANVRITDTCHLVTWQHRDTLLTEVVTTVENQLPSKRRLLNCRLRGDRAETVQCGVGVMYQTTFLVERLERTLYSRMHNELESDSQLRGISHNFRPHDRLSPSPLSHISIEARSRSLLIQAFHTFPDDCAILKTQSLFELR